MSEYRIGIAYQYRCIMYCRGVRQQNIWSQVKHCCRSDETVRQQNYGSRHPINEKKNSGFPVWLFRDKNLCANSLVYSVEAHTLICEYSNLHRSRDCFLLIRPLPPRLRRCDSTKDVLFNPWCHSTVHHFGLEASCSTILSLDKLSCFRNRPNHPLTIYAPGTCTHNSFFEFLPNYWADCTVMSIESFSFWYRNRITEINIEGQCFNSLRLRISVSHDDVRLCCTRSNLLGMMSERTASTVSCLSSLRDLRFPKGTSFTKLLSLTRMS